MLDDNMGSDVEILERRSPVPRRAACRLTASSDGTKERNKYNRNTYIGGLQTAETFALPYLEMGVTTYSSAILNFLPEFAQEFYAAVRRRDHTTVYAGLREFVLPHIEFRGRSRGYDAAIVKAGMTAAGRSAGPVRTPLLDLTASELEELGTLMKGRC